MPMRNILYVEDDDVNAFILTKMLEEHYCVQVVQDGEQCLEVMQKNAFDLVLMDINLGTGKMDGVETMKKIKEQEVLRHIPVFAVTSYAMPGDRERYLHEGFDRYFPKPIIKTDLLKVIAHIL